MAENKTKKEKKSVKTGESITMDGTNDKVLAAISVFPLVGLIIFFAMNDASEFIKNYARHGSILTIWVLILPVIGWIPIIGWIISCISTPILIIITIILIVNALQENKDYKLPVLGDLAESIFK